MDRNQMRKRIKAITGGFRNSTPAVMDKATKIAATIKGKAGGCNSAQELALAAALSESSGLDVVAAYNKLPNNNGTYPQNRYFQPMVALVATQAYSGHNAPLHEPLVSIDAAYLTGDYRTITKGGIITSNLYNPPNGNALRLATDEEIDRLSDAQLDYFVKLYS